MSKPAKNKKLMRNIAVLVLVIAGIGVLGVLMWRRAKEVHEVRAIEIQDLPANGKTQLIDTKRLESDQKVVLLLFTMQKEEGFVYVDNLLLVDAGNWGLEIPSQPYLPEDGEYIQIQKLYAAGERVQEGTTGVVHLMDKMESFAGVGIDGYIAINEYTGGGMSWSSFFGNLSMLSFWLKPGSSKDLVESIRSDLTQDALLKVAETMRSGDVVFDALSLDGAEVVQYQDGQIRVFDSDYVDGIVRGFPKATDLLLEQPKVEVYNGTGVTGLAGRYARFFRNSGFTVTRVEDSLDYYETTTIYVPERSQYEKSVEVLVHDMGKEVAVREDAPGFLSTADIIVVLGYDAVRW